MGYWSELAIRIANGDVKVRQRLGPGERAVSRARTCGTPNG